MQNENDNNDNNNLEKSITDRIEEVYHFMQYGKLMPGIIHNFNGKFAMIDSKIQLASMKLNMKLKKLETNKIDLSEDVYEALTKEYQDLSKLLEGLNKGREGVNSMMQGLNGKVSNEFSHKNEMIDICNVIKEFDDYFMFYKRYKHDTRKEFEFDGSPFIKMKSKDFNFLLFATVKNCVDATAGNTDSYDSSGELKNIVRYRVIKKESSIQLRIFNNGKEFEDNEMAFSSLKTDKVSYSSEDAVFDTPVGSGLDLFFLKRILDKYEGVTYSIESLEDIGTEYVFSFPKI